MTSRGPDRTGIARTADPRRRGRLLVGTSGFAYPDWIPRFYPPGTRPPDLLRHYATRLSAVELNNTFYQQPRPEKVTAWLASTPRSFRFAVKAQRGGTSRSFMEPAAGLPWLTDPYRAFDDRLGMVLFRVPPGAPDQARLAAFLRAWPADMPLAVELTDPRWEVDETFGALAAIGATVVATEGPDDPAPPTLRRTGDALYLRLRRHDYDQVALNAWAERLEPFLADGVDAYVFFRHDDVGRGGELALAFAAMEEVPR